MFHIHQCSDRLKIYPKCIICGDCNYKGFTVSHMCLCRHQYRRINDSTAQFCSSITGTRCNYHNIQEIIRSDRLCLLDRPNSLIPCNRTDLINKFLSISKSCITALCLIRKDGNNIRSHLRQFYHFFFCFCKCTKRSCDSISYIKI